MNKIITIISTNIHLFKYLLFFILFSIIYGLTNRVWFSKKPRSYKIPLDDKIPLIPWTILIYNIWFPLMIITFIIFAITNKSTYFHMIYLYIISNILSNLFFIFFQNEVPQGDLLIENNIINKLYNLTKKVDNPYNGLPSIHVLTCLICSIGLIYTPILLVYKMLLIVFFILIIVTTFTTKQHVVLDALGSVIVLLVSQLIYAILF